MGGAVVHPWMLLFLALGMAHATRYTCFAQRTSTKPLISSQYPLGVGYSGFLYAYNTAYVPLLDGLLVRAQDITNASDPYSVGPSVLALTSRTRPYIKDNASVVFAPFGDAENFGVEDPRVVYHEALELYLLTYTAAQRYANGTVVARLALASSRSAKQWHRHGPMFGGADGWSKSGALALRPGQPDVMIFGDSTVVPGLQLARVDPLNISHWTADSRIYLPVRKDNFDSVLVEVMRARDMCVCGDAVCSWRWGRPDRRQ